MISVIVTAYNIEKYIERCLLSIINSSYKDLEIIVIDDGSSDKSGQIIDEISHKDARIICLHQANGGVSAARNKGLDMATGEYISFVDGDDYISDDMFEKMMEKMPDYDIVETSQYFVDDQKYWRKAYQTNAAINGMDLCREIAGLRYLTLAPHSRLYKSALIKTLRFPVGLVFEDNYFISVLFPMIKRVYKLELPKGYFHYKRAGSITLSYDEKIYDMLKIQKLIYEHFKAENILSKYYLILQRNALRGLIVSLLGRKMAFVKDLALKKEQYYKIRDFMLEYYGDYWHNKYIPITQKLLAKYLCSSYNNVVLFHKILRLFKKG